MRELLVLLAFAVAWVGHACVWTAVLNNLYGRPLPKAFLKPWRYITGLIIVAFPLLLLSGFNTAWFGFVNGSSVFLNGYWGWCVVGYAAVCLVFGGVVFPVITVVRLRRETPACVVSET